MRILIGIFILSWAFSTSAMTKSGVKFEDALKLNGNSLVLNGLGVREATFFSIEVYVAGIYLEKKTKNPKEILNSKSPKVLKMKFVRDVGSDRINPAWEKALEGHGLNSELGELKAATPDLKEGDELMFSFDGNLVKYHYNQKQVAGFKNEKLSRALLNIWFGSDPPNESLKSGMLGI